MGKTIRKSKRSGNPGKTGKQLPVMEVCREKGCIGLSFSYNRELIELTRGLSKRWWDGERKMWWVPDSESARDELRTAFKGKVRFVKTGDDQEPSVPPKVQEPIILLEMAKRMEEQHYSPVTVEVYLNMFREFMGYFPLRDPAYISETEIRTYFQTLEKVKELTKTYKHQSVNAIKFFYEQVLGRDKMLLSLPGGPIRPNRTGLMSKGITPQLDDYLRSA